MIVASWIDSHKQETESQPEFEPAKLKVAEEDESIHTGKFIFKKAVIGTKYLYAGDYFCWHSPNNSFFNAINVNQAESSKQNIQI